MNKRRIIQIGLGGWGWSWLEIVRASPYWQLAGIVDRDRAVLDRAITTYGFDPASVATSLGDYTAVHEADAALVVVPPEFHAPVTCDAIEAGLHCLVEKPVAGTIADAVVMVDAAARHNRRLMVSQNYRFRVPRKRLGDWSLPG